MQHNDTPLHMINEQLQRIWEAHGLGSIQTITRPARGMKTVTENLEIL